MGAEAQNEGYFAKFPLLSKIQTLSYKPLVRQTSNYQHCNWHAQNPTCREFQVISSSSSQSKTTLCILRKKYGFQKGNAMEKNKICFHQKEMFKMAWNSMHIGFWTCQFQWHRFQDCTFRRSDLWTICMHYLENCSSQGYFWNILQHYSSTTPDNNSQEMFHISSLIVLFSYGKVKDIFGIRIKFHMGIAKGRTKRWVWGQKHPCM